MRGRGRKSWRAAGDGYTAAGQGEAVTVAKASLDLSQFCQAEPFGPKQVVLPLQ